MRWFWRKDKELPVSMDANFEWVKQQDYQAYNYAQLSDGGVVGEVYFGKGRWVSKLTSEDTTNWFKDSHCAARFVEGQFSTEAAISEVQELEKLYGEAQAGE
jgi:hypothetical protein